MRGWPEEVVTWLRENVPGRTSKEVAEIINQQGYDRKYGMTFTESMIKGAKNRYGIKSGTPSGTKKGSSFKYPEGMEEYVRSIAPGRKTGRDSRNGISSFRNRVLRQSVQGI